MSTETPELFPKDPKKTYGLMEVVKGTGPMVDKGPDDTVSSWSHLLLLEVLVTLGTTVLLLLWSVAAKAPLREIANPDVTENPAKAAWYFLSLQELLLHMHPALAGFFVPVLLILVLMAVPYLDRSKDDMGVWFSSKKGKSIAIWSAVYTTVWCLGLILFDEFIRVRAIVSDPEIFPSWIIPIGVMVGLIALLYFMIRRWHPSRREMMVGMFTAFVATYFILTLTSLFFRGSGMHLTWPWNLPPGALPF